MICTGMLFLTTLLMAQQRTKGEYKKSSNPDRPPFIRDLEKMPEILPKCAEGCLRPLLLSLRASFVSGNNYERVVNTCDRLRETYECMDFIKKCQPNHLFRVVTDGLRYMCVEYPDAFRDLMECMDLHAHIATEVMRSTTFFRVSDSGLPPRVNVIFFRKITTEGCTILQCYFLCLKTKYNARCHGIGGNMLMEVVIRPLAAIHNSLLLSPIWNVIKLMMPIQCNFIMTDAGVDWQRVDPKLEQDLKEFYNNRSEPLVKFRRLQQTGLGKFNAGNRAKRKADYDKIKEDRNKVSDVNGESGWEQPWKSNEYYDVNSDDYEHNDDDDENDEYVDNEFKDRYMNETKQYARP